MSAPDESPSDRLLDPGEMNRLALIRLLYRQGVEQARQPRPLSAASILTFHDTTELFLILAAEHLKAGPVARDSSLLQYWTVLRPRRGFAGVELSGQHGIGRLISVRNDVKHLGTFPRDEDVADARSAVTSFLEDNTPKVFGLEFASIDMAEVIPQADVRDKVKAASPAAAASDLAEAMGLLAEAYDDLFRIAGPQPSPVSGTFGKTLSTYGRTPKIGDVAFDNHLAQISEAVREMQRGLRVMALGIDYWQFVRFQQLTPSIIYLLGGTGERRYPRDYAPTADEFAFCRQFIITVALRIAEAESHIAVPPEGTA